MTTTTTATTPTPCGPDPDIAVAENANPAAAGQAAPYATHPNPTKETIPMTDQIPADKVREIIALATRGAHTTGGHPMKMSDHTAQIIAESLADEGMLQPDLPEPDGLRTTPVVVPAETVCIEFPDGTTLYGTVTAESTEIDGHVRVVTKTVRVHQEEA